MGGNTSVINENNERIFEAEKIDLTIFNITFIQKKVKSIFKVLNEEDIFNNSSIKDLYTGSSELIFNKVKDKNFSLLKPTLGDIDLAVPIENKEKLWKLLKTLENKKISKNITYRGNNKPTITSIRNQINAIFEIKKYSKTLFMQIDFVFTEFKDNKPNDFFKFAHSYSEDDFWLLERYSNLKGGLAHKLMLRAIASEHNKFEDILVLTPKATKEKPRIKKNFKTSKYTFSVDRGIRECLIKMDYKVQDKEAFKELEINNSIYETDLEKIFVLLFEPIKNNLRYFDKIKSYQGLIFLINEYKSITEKFNILDRLIELLWGKDAQKLEKDIGDNYEAKSLDKKIKLDIFDYFLDNIKFREYKYGLDKYLDKYLDLSEEFYKKY